MNGLVIVYYLPTAISIIVSACMYIKGFPRVHQLSLGSNPFKKTPFCIFLAVVLGTKLRISVRQNKCLLQHLCTPRFRKNAKEDVVPP